MTKTRVTAYLTAVFLTGALAGGLGGYTLAHRKAVEPPGREDMTAHMAQFVKSRLQLTDQQLKEIQPILNETGNQFQTAYCGMADRVNEILSNASQRIAPYLTPEQKHLLVTLDREREERLRDTVAQASPK